MTATGVQLLDPEALLHRCGVESGWHIADLGCGSLGHFVFPAARMVGADGRVYAVDIQKAALQMIERIAKREQIWNVYPVWSDIEILNAATIPAGSLDLTLIVNNFYLSKVRGQIAAEATRLTKIGGRVLVIDWDQTSAPLGPPIGERVQEDEVQQFFFGQGCSLTESFPAGDHHYGLLFTRGSLTSGSQP